MGDDKRDQRSPTGESGTTLDLPAGCEVVGHSPTRYKDKDSGAEFYLCPWLTPEGKCGCGGAEHVKCDGRLSAEMEHDDVQSGATIANTQHHCYAYTGVEEWERQKVVSCHAGDGDDEAYSETAY